MMKNRDIYFNDNYKSETVESSIEENSTEAKISRLWSEILNSNKKVDVNDSFFKMGGNSLGLMQFHARLDKLFPGKVTIPDFFAYSTISKLAKFIDDMQVGEKPNHTLKYTILSSEYFQSELDNCGCLHFNFQIRGDLLNKVRIVAETENVSIKDMMIVAFLFLLAKIGEEKEVEVLAILDSPNEAIRLNVDFSNNKDFSRALSLVNNQIKQRSEKTTYTLEDIGMLKDDKIYGSVLPIIVLTDLNTYDDELLDIFDIIFEIGVESNKVCLMLSFNAEKLDEVRMEELVENYVELLSHIVDRYNHWR